MRRKPASKQRERRLAHAKAQISAAKAGVATAKGQLANAQAAVKTAELNLALPESFRRSMVWQAWPRRRLEIL